MGILTWRGFGCDQEDSWSGVEQAIALWCCEIPKARKGYYRTIFGSGSLRLRISLYEMNELVIVLGMCKQFGLNVEVNLAHAFILPMKSCSRRESDSLIGTAHLQEGVRTTDS